MKTEQLTYQLDQHTNQLLFNSSYEKRLSTWRNLRNTATKDDNFIDTLDINILNNFIFKKHLNISDVNNDERIRFIAGCHGLEALEKKVDENNDSVAFSIFPSSISDVITVANKNLTMPPKSTWFDPKPLDGLVVYEFEKVYDVREKLLTDPLK